MWRGCDESIFGGLGRVIVEGGEKRRLVRGWVLVGIGREGGR